MSLCGLKPKCGQDSAPSGSSREDPYARFFQPPGAACSSLAQGSMSLQGHVFVWDSTSLDSFF